MTLKEAGNLDVWFDDIKKKISPFKCAIEHTLNTKIVIYLASFSLEVYPYHNLTNSLKVNDVNGRICSLWINLDGNIAKSIKAGLIETNLVFQQDDDGIAILAKKLNMLDSIDEDKVISVIKEVDKIYRERFRGKLAGKKFGF